LFCCSPDPTIRTIAFDDGAYIVLALAPSSALNENTGRWVLLPPEAVLLPEGSLSIAKAGSWATNLRAWG